MPQLMRCPYCGLLQDEPKGVKACARCGGALEFEGQSPAEQTYLQVQMELDQVAAPPDQNIERYLLVTFRTPKEVPPEEAAPTEGGRPALNFNAVLDVSGSMRGPRLEQAKAAVQQALQYLRPGDVFSMATFSQKVSVPFKANPVSEKTYHAVKDALQEIAAGGMTALCDGLERGIKNAHRHPRDSNLALLLSDGHANRGETDLEKIGQRAYKARVQGTTVSCLGIGTGYNEALLAEIANQGGGRYYHVVEAHQIPAFLGGELGEAAMLAARDVEIQLDVPAGATLIPLSAAYPVKQSGGKAFVRVGDIPCDTELMIPLRLALLGQPSGSQLSIQGVVRFQSPAGNKFERDINRVTVRFLQQGVFQLREGVVLPVAERIFTQLRASSVLGVARALSYQPAEADQHRQSHLTRLRSYADLLGEGRAQAELQAIREDFDAISSPSPASKALFSNSYRAMRSTKDFSK